MLLLLAIHPASARLIRVPADYPTIQLAVNAAASNDQIWVNSGTYRESVYILNKNGLALYGSFAGNEKSPAERNLKANRTIIDGSTANQGQPADRVFMFHGILSNMRLDGFTITGGGRAVYCETLDGTSVIANCTMTGNQGGGLTLSRSSPLVFNCIFEGNSAPMGAAIYAGGQYDSISHPQIINCTFWGNRADYPGGAGAIYCKYSAPTIRNSIFAGNTNVAILNSEGGPILTHCLFHNNPQGDYGSSRDYYGLEILLYIPGSSHIYTGDPLFVDPAHGDFHLRDKSPALDRGMNTSLVASDFEGDPRPGGDNKTDIGADEAAPSFGSPDIWPPISLIEGLAPRINTTATSFNFTCRAIDAESGIRQTILLYRRNGGPWKQIGGPLGTGTITFNAPQTEGDGNYELTTQATDGQGNIEPLFARGKVDILVVRSFSGSRIYVDPDAVAPSATSLGSSWPTAVHTLSGALWMASRFGVLEIWVADGVYYNSVTFTSGMKLYGGFAGYGPGSESSISQRDFKNHCSIIDVTQYRRTDPYQQAVVINKADFTLDGFKITGGMSDYGKDHPGGGVSCTYASGNISNCTIQNNKSGGIYALDSKILVQNCTILDNTGRGVTSDNGGVWSDSGMDFINCIFGRNTAPGSAGGGVYADDANFTNCLFFNNSAGSGGGVFMKFPSTPVRITNCTFYGNHSDTDGGAIIVHEGFGRDQLTTITNTIFAANSQYAVYNSTNTTSSNPALVNCLFYGNYPGIYTDDSVNLSSANQVNATLPRSSGNRDGDPRFFIPSADDFHLLPSSSAIDRGSSLGAPAFDLDNKPRPAEVRGVGGYGPANAFDIGAYEYQPPPNAARTWSLYP